MRAYQSTLGDFFNDIRTNCIVSKIKEQTKMSFGEGQIRAFRNSLPRLKDALENVNIPGDVDVAIEMQVPLTMKRMDFVIAGSDEKDKDHVIIIELKQWDRVKHTDMPDIVKVDYYGRDKDEVHPSWQAYSYQSTICSFNDYVAKNNVDVKSCAFLHNYEEQYKDELLNPIYDEGTSLSKTYIENQYVDLAAFVSKYIKKKSKNNLLFELNNGRIKPSKMLCDALGSTLNGNKEFELIDEQRIVYSNLLSNLKKDVNDTRKHVYIVRGGMGTGKTLVAIQLLSALIRERKLKAFYVAKSSYVKAAYMAKLTRDIPNFKFLRTLFMGSGNFIDSALNDFDCLLVDEAHRLMERTKKSWFYQGENQIREIIHATKTAVFFIDEDQQVDIKDYGSIENIKKIANEFNAVIHDDHKYILKSQFRCNGSDEYVAFIKSILYNQKYIPSGEVMDYDIRVFDDIMELKRTIDEKNQKETSRMLSGDVFPWASRTDKTQIDINIGDFHAQWNKKDNFAVNPNSIDEVGCIHTSQGMDFAYVGLIIGDDLIYRNGKVLTDYTKHPDKAAEYKRPHQQKVNPEDQPIIDRLIRNTYKVLMTRGNKGLYLYIMDNQLKEYIKGRIEEIRQNNNDIRLVS